MQQTAWHHLSGCQTAAEPTISSHADGLLYAVAVRTDGQVVFTSIRRDSDGWSAWRAVDAGSPPQLPASTSTPPVLRRSGDWLYLFCRGVDDDVYVTSRHASGDWVPWHKLTADRSVRGRISVTFTNDPSSVHLVHQGAAHTVHYRQFDASWSLHTTSKWTDVADAEIASDGTGEVLVALRSTADRLSLLRQEHPWGGTWYPVVNEHGAEFDQPCLALSNVVTFAGGFHLLFATKVMLDDIGGSSAYTLAHTRVQAHRYSDGYFRVVHEYSPVQERHPQPTLAVYRNKLVAAFADEQTNIRAAWLDSADADTPWIGGHVVAGGMSRAKPALAPHDFWRNLSTPSLLERNFGNDLFAVVSGLTGNSVWFANFSRAYFVDHLASIGHRVDWCLNYDGTFSDCPPLGIALPATSDLPEYSEIAYGSMTIPFRIMRTLFPRVMDHEKEPGSDYMAWIHTLVLPAAYIGPHMNVDFTMPHGSWQHEMLHRLASSMALWDDDNPANHPNPNLMDDFWPDYLVKAATTLFREQTDDGRACGLGGDGNRCRGFVRDDPPPPTGSPLRTGWRYDVGCCQHSFIEFVQLYISNGPLLRRLIVADLREGVDLLHRKYEWVRRFIFGGVEFGAHGVPVYPVHLLNRNSKKALDVKAWSLDNNGALHQYALHGGDNQRWLLVPKGHGYHQIISMHSGLALDVAGISHDDGAEVQQYEPHDGANQQWQLIPDMAGSYELVARHSGMCLEVVGWSMYDGGAVSQYTRHGGDNQKWFLEPA
jgi:hypothetical protein